MSIIENSIVCRFLLSLWGSLVRLWRKSLLSRLFTSAGERLTSLFRESRTAQMVCREGAVTRAWPQSLTCWGLDGLLNLPCLLVKAIYRKGKPLWDSSFFCRLLSGLGSGAALLTGLFMLVMLCAPHAHWNNAYAFLGMVGITTLFCFSTGGRDTRLEVPSLDPHLVLFFGFVAMAVAGSLKISLSLRFFLFHLTGFLLVLVLTSAVRSVRELQTTAAAACGGLLIASLYGCYQGVIGVAVVASQQDMVLNAGMPGRVYSFFDNPNNFAEILVMLLPLTLALFLNAETLRGKVAALGVFAAGLIAIGYTYSRSGWLGLALAVFLFLALQNWRIVPFALAAAVLALPFLPESIYNRFLTIGNMNDTSTRYRFAIYEATSHLMEDYWLTGVGLGSDVMTRAFATYPTMYDGNHPIHTHNNYLQMWGELGLAGGLAYLAMVLRQVKRGVGAFYAAQNRKVKNLLSAAIGSFCGILLIGVAEYTWFYPRNMFLFFFLLALIAACVRLVKAER